MKKRLSMITARPLFVFLSALTLGLALSTAKAEQSQDFGDYVAHFIALPTSFLTPKVATEFKITRSKHRAFLNISMLKKHMGTSGEPVSARVEANAVNLTGQARNIPMREVLQGQAIYQLGAFKIHNEETLDFTIEITPRGEDRPYIVKFRQQFFVD